MKYKFHHIEKIGNRDDEFLAIHAISSFTINKQGLIVFTMNNGCTVYQNEGSEAKALNVVDSIIKRMNSGD